MALRIMVYTGLLYQDLIKSKAIGSGQKLPPFFPDAWHHHMALVMLATLFLVKQKWHTVRLGPCCL